MTAFPDDTTPGFVKASVSGDLAPRAKLHQCQEESRNNLAAAATAQRFITPNATRKAKFATPAISPAANAANIA
jgi:hypothetical protein